MSLWDSISSGIGSATDWLSGSGGQALSTVANVAGAGFDLYNGIQSMNLADKYANMSFATAEKQNEYASEMWDRYKNTYWPLEDKQNTLTNNQLDLALSPEIWDSYANVAKRSSQVAANEAWLDMNRAEDMYGTYDTTERSLIRKLTEGEDVLRDRMMTQASTDVKSSFADASTSLNTQLGLAGISTTSPQAWASRTELAQSEALANAAARTNAANTAEDTTMNRWATALNYKNGGSLSTNNYTSPSSIMTANGLSPSGGNYGSGALGSFSASSGNYSNLANMYNNNAQSSLTGFGGLLKMLTTGSSS